MADIDISSCSSDSESDEEIIQPLSLCTGFSADSSPIFSSSFVPKASAQQKGVSKTETEEIVRKPWKHIKLSSSLQPGKTLSGTYLSIFPDRNPSEAKEKLKQLALGSRVSELESKNVVGQPGFEQQYTLAPYMETKGKIRREKLKERDKTKGGAWFNMPATEITDEIKNDMTILQMRNALDPKHFYKSGSEKICPKYFQVGTVVETPIDFYHARIPKKQRKRTLVDELMADAEFRQYQKKKYTEALKNQPQKFLHSSQKEKKLKRKGASMEAMKNQPKKFQHSSQKNKKMNQRGTRSEPSRNNRKAKKVK